MKSMSFGEYMQMAERVFFKLQVEATHRQLNSLALYVERLILVLKQVRLTGESSAEELFNKQIYDSLYPLKIITFKKGGRILDLGSGGGLPGIPLSIALPENEIVLLDSSKKKTTYIEETVKRLALKNVKAVNGRAEEYGHLKGHRGSYDYVVSKAVAEMDVLAEYTLPFLKIQGDTILYKGPRGEKELIAAAEAIKICGGKYQQKHHYRLPGGEERALYIIRKTDITPEKYPRRIGVPKKNPIK